MEISNRAAFDDPDRSPPSWAALRLAALLAQRLDEVVPRPFRVRPADGMVALYEGGTWDSSTEVADILDRDIDPVAAAGERGSFAWNAAGAAWNVLSHVQDGVSEGTTNPWPPLASGEMAMPGTRTDGARVFLWYGPHHERDVDAVLSLAPIALDELVAPE
jgi:hypothetical protein